MSTTSPLSVIADRSMDEKTVCIHVGNVSNPASLPDDACVYGKTLLKNEIRHGSVELGVVSAEKLGAREATVQHYPGERYGTIIVAPA